MESDKENRKRERNPEESANLLSVLTVSWILKVFLKNRKQELKEDDLYEPLKGQESSYVGDEIEKYWSEEEQRAKKQNRKPSLLKVLVRIHLAKVLLLGIILFFVETLKIVQTLYLGVMLRYFAPNSIVTKEEAYIGAATVIGCSAVTVFVVNPTLLSVINIGMKMRVSCCSLIYRKALRLSKTALGQTTPGQVVNLVSNDVARFEMIALFVHYLYIGPVQTLIILYFLWEQIGVASIIGLAALIIFIPFQGWLGKKTSSYRMKIAKRTDERVRLMNEIISGIQVIKMYTWEKPFAKLVSYARKKEIEKIRGVSYVRGIMLSFIIFNSRLAIFCSIFSYVLFGNDITAEKVFVVTSFFNILRFTMTMIFPGSIAMVAETLVSIKRLQTFMLYDETTVPDKNKKTDVKNGIAEEMVPLMPKYQSQPILRDKSIDIRKATAKWLPDSHENTLNDINLKVEAGKLTVIIGPVGSGKTSLLHVILQELPLSSGSVTVGGLISYASQEPWLFAGSVRQNILFGMEYNKDRYKQVIKVCALRPDFEQFPYGDKTIVGERGVSLSGGQRARINLARAVYKQADIYLLDDPLSAVDTHVGKHLFEDCITGFLKNKTCILITHQLQYLTNVEHIVFLENSKIQAEGNYQEVQLKAKNFIKLITDDGEEVVKKTDSIGKLNQVSPISLRRPSFQSMSSLYDEPDRGEPPSEAEVRSHGSVGGKVYGLYFRSLGNCCVILSILFLVIFTQLLASCSDYWIAFWVNIEERNHNLTAAVTTEQPFNISISTTPTITETSTITNVTLEEDNFTNIPFTVDRNTSLYIFSALTLATICVTLVRSFLFFYSCTKASKRLHNHMFDSITRTTMRFFNNNSSGQILNRFSKDIGNIDEMLPGALMDCLQIGLTMLGITVVIAIVNIWLAIPTLVMTVILYTIRRFYMPTSRSIKRLEGVSKLAVPFMVI
uniref:Cystic fibrosis transmembrane conductance regulator n=1 Tax=Clastoptera arizonana TaxID=38151 RepID=A0A1B6EFU5_9HEMI